MRCEQPVNTAYSDSPLAKADRLIAPLFARTSLVTSCGLVPAIMPTARDWNPIFLKIGADHDVQNGEQLLPSRSFRSTHTIKWTKIPSTAFSFPHRPCPARRRSNAKSFLLLRLLYHKPVRKTTMRAFYASKIYRGGKNGKTIRTRYSSPAAHRPRRTHTIAQKPMGHTGAGGKAVPGAPRKNAASGCRPGR